MANYPSYYSGFGQNTMPQMPTYQYTQQTIQAPQELIRVTGIEGAKAYQMAPNSVVPLFDANNDIMYIKSTDGAGFPSIRAFSFEPMDTPHQSDNTTEFVKRSEFDALVEEVKGLIDGKQPVSNAKPDTKQ